MTMGSEPRAKTRTSLADKQKFPRMLAVEVVCGWMYAISRNVVVTGLRNCTGGIVLRVSKEPLDCRVVIGVGGGVVVVGVGPFRGDAVDMLVRGIFLHHFFFLPVNAWPKLLR